MKNKTIFALFLILSFTLITSTISAQTITVTPSKITYRRPKPIDSYKKTFTVIRPKVKGVSTALARKIESAVSYEKHFDFKIQEEIKEYQWLAEASYEVDYNKKGILGVTLMIDGSGAYPSTSSVPVIVNIKTGTQVTPKDVFINAAGLVAKLKAKQQAEIKQGILDIKKENPEEENPASLFENANFTAENLAVFTVSDKGVTFWYDYDFAHVIQAWQPLGRFQMSWAQMKPHIKPGSLFAQFVR